MEIFGKYKLYYRTCFQVQLNLTEMKLLNVIKKRNVIKKGLCSDFICDEKSLIVARKLERSCVKTVLL